MRTVTESIISFQIEIPDFIPGAGELLCQFFKFSDPWCLLNLNGYNIRKIKVFTHTEHVVVIFQCLYRGRLRYKLVKSAKTAAWSFFYNLCRTFLHKPIWIEYAGKGCHLSPVRYCEIAALSKQHLTFDLVLWTWLVLCRHTKIPCLDTRKDLMGKKEVLNINPHSPPQLGLIWNKPKVH